MKNLLFIYNPTSGKGKVNESLPTILDVFTKAGWLVTAYPTQSRGDAIRAARDLAPHFGRVVCAGGDGTLNEVVTGLAQLSNAPALGYIPLGSTNDSATTLQLPRSPAQAAALAAGDTQPRPIDIGTFNGKPFAYVAAFGAFTHVAYDTPQDLKNTFGHLAYVLAGIASIPSIAPYRIRVEHDGQVIEDSFYFGMVRNALSIAGFRLPNNKNVELDDGLFEVDLVKKPVSLTDISSGFQTLLPQNSADGGARIHFQTSKVTFTCEGDLSWTIDGEFGGNANISVVENHPRALSVIRGE